MPLTVIIPAYNEAANIRALLQEVAQHIPPGSEILVIDDGSTDDTARLATEAGARVVSHPVNIGNGAAIKTGIRSASHDLLVLMDGDRQHDPADIPAMLAKAEHYDMVVGARAPQTHASIIRRLGNALYNRLASYVTRFPVKDLTSGFRVLYRSTAMHYLYLLPNTFSYPTTITLAYLHGGRSIHYLPIRARTRAGRSKIRLLHDGLRFFLIILKIATLYAPLMIFIPVSSGMFCLGLLNYAYTYIIGRQFTNMSALLMISAIIIFMMGLVSEQITQLRYDRTQNNG